MRKYFHFYNLMKLTKKTKRGTGFLMLFVIINTLIYDAFFTNDDQFTLGFTFLFILTVLISSYYAFIIHSNPDNPVYDFPLTSKQRVFYLYLNAIFIFLVVAICMVIFGYLMVGLFALIGNTQGDTVSDPFYLSGTLYSIGYLIIFFALYMPISFFKSTKQRYIYGAIASFILVIINFLVTLIISGSINFPSNIPMIMEESSLGLVVAILILTLSFLALYFSYNKSKKLVKYE